VASNTKASEAAEKKAQELGVDLSEVKGTGNDGAITVKDVQDHSESRAEEAKRREEIAEASERLEEATANVSDKKTAKAMGADVKVRPYNSDTAIFPVYPPTGEERRFSGDTFVSSEEWKLVEDSGLNLDHEGNPLLVKVTGRG
jgi:pyruvate/2-oxoglutarate dehydrogenase complex dihydrolipoamide acyltransferase (E2) component